MKELEILVKKMNDVLNEKEEELSSQEGFNQHSKDFISNKREQILSFSNGIKDLVKDPFLKKKIICDFTKDADRIINEIRMIKNNL